MVLLMTVHGEMYCGDSNCYDILSLDRASADSGSIKKAYRQLSKQWHPDKNPDKVEEATAKFQQIATAYEVLSSEEMKAAYDYFLDHPEEQMYNTMRYYSVRYQPKTPVWVVLLGLAVVISLIQYFHFMESARGFQASPELKKMLEDEYLRNCTRGRQGYNSGELSQSRKEEIKIKFMETIAEDPQCPLYWKHWHYTLLPSLFWRYPAGLFKAIRWRIAHHDEISAEKAAKAQEQKDEEERIRLEEEESEKLAAEKEAKKKENAKRLEEKRRAEEAKKEKWLEEAQREKEEEEAAKANRSLIVKGRVASVDEMRKKGHLLVEIVHGDDEETVQLIVVEKKLCVGQEVSIALEGAELPNGKVVTRQKIAGEWSEGELLEIFAAPVVDPTATVDDSCDMANESEMKEEDDDKGQEQEGKPKQRKKKNK